ncbi:MAG: hypothetical protein FJZ01_20385 [Candidatus Sericytochromatia bacterium]|nr:hypothetical protein [Candidatus Tanganyikabacteria bacterium]
MIRSPDAARLAALLPALLACGLLVARPAAGAPFEDVAGDQAFIANALGSRDVLPPVWGAVLAPHAPVYRYEQAWMLAAMLDPKEHPFSVIAWPDVPPGHWALLAVNRIVGVGVLKEEDGRFNGDRRIRRDEFVATLDKVLTYRALPPPPPRKAGIVSFPDARTQAVDRAANFWQFLDPAPRFRPTEILTRAEAVEMLAKAAPLVDRSFIALLTPPTPTPVPPTPTPRPTPRPAATPAPSGSPGMVVSATSEPGVTPGPELTPSAEPLPRQTLPPFTWQWEGAPSLASVQFGDLLGVSYAFPSGGDVSVRGSAGPLVGAGSAGGRAILVTSDKRTQFNVSASARGLFELGSEGARPALGANVLADIQSVTAPANPDVAKKSSRTFLGAGPAGQVAVAAGPVDLTAGAQMQIGVAIGQGVGFGFGVGYQVEGRLPGLLGDIGALAAVRGQMVSPGGGYDFMNSLLLGLGGGF